MTTDECIKALQQAEQDYQDKISPLYKSHRENCNKILNDWAQKNAKYKIGDIVSNGDSTILVDTILGMRFTQTPFIEYSGHLCDNDGKINPYKFGYVLEQTIK